MSTRHAAPTLATAVLSGARTPLGRLFGDSTSPALLAGRLYLGRVLGLALLMTRLATTAAQPAALLLKVTAGPSTTS